MSVVVGRQRSHGGVDGDHRLHRPLRAESNPTAAWLFLAEHIGGTRVLPIYRGGGGVCCNQPSRGGIHDPREGFFSSNRNPGGESTRGGFFINLNSRSTGPPTDAAVVFLPNSQ